MHYLVQISTGIYKMIMNIFEALLLRDLSALLPRFYEKECSETLRKITSINVRFRRKV